MIDEIKKEPKESYLIGHKLREIEVESKFSQELSLPMIESIVPYVTIAAVLVVEGRLTQRERKLNLLVTVLLVIMMNLYTAYSIGAILEKMAQGLRYICRTRIIRSLRKCFKRLRNHTPVLTPL